MKRWIGLLLIFVLCLGLWGCESKSEEVKYAENLIASIGTVEVSSGDSLRVAWEAYLALPEEEQSAVSNYDALVEAQAIYDSYFETVEITDENWFEYFTVEQPYFWGADAFGDVDSVCRPLQVRVAEEYANRIYLEQSDLNVSYVELVYQFYCPVDWQAQTIEPGQNAAYLGLFKHSWHSGDGGYYTSYEKQYRAMYDDGNLLFSDFGEYAETRRIDDRKNYYVNISEYSISEVVGTITVLKPEYEPIPTAREQEEASASAEGYTLVELTMDNWQDYLELRYEEDWRYQESMGLNTYNERVYMYVKEEWQDKVSYSYGTNIQIKTAEERIQVLYEADWENHVFTMGEQMGTYRETANEVFEYVAGSGVSSEAGRLMSIGNRVYISLQSRGEGPYQLATDSKTGKPYAWYAESFEVSRIAGTLYLVDE